MKLTLCASLLVMAMLPAQGISPAAREAFESLELQVSDSIRAWQTEQRRAAEEAAKEAKASGNRMIPAMSMVPPLGQHIPAFLAAAEKFKGTEDAVPFLIRVLRLGGMEKDKTPVKDALGTLLSSHIASPQLVDIFRDLMPLERSLGKPFVEEALARLTKESPHGDVRAMAIFSGYAATLERADVQSDAYKAAKAEVLAAAATHKSALVRDRVLKIESSRETLAEGGVAQDITGIDLDGEAFRLSDYKGSIILLSFWGHW
jgi:hypothetical protein